MAYDIDKSRLDDVVKYAGQLYATIEKHRAEIQTLKQSMGVLQPYADAPYRKWSIETAVERENQFKEVVEQSRAICEANDAAYKANQILIQKLAAVIEGAGLATTKVVRKGRSAWKTERVSADWLASLRGAIDAPSSTINGLNDFVKRVTELRKAKEAERLRQEAQDKSRRENEERERRRTVVVVDVAKELGIEPVSTDFDSLREELLKRDKYLELAVAMEQTRGDWSDGFYRVEYALRSFREKANCELDHKIISCVSGRMDDEDGRTFRDCQYSYDVIYGYVEPSIMALYEKLENSWRDAPAAACVK